ncbi:GNAT family N-acetyltransferase [Trinickia dinghuensis]|uniref:GNAT family N-acetyltransferase n=1 Tax=Trinickia dinghuensis TaxID=2291023 RepID=A0A3D8JSE2_9BURK|nr:GNAT family N-acetyltransferase [Trinickia dinghuensis]RDU95655.1 GNAT family N-acetyltransferase [Trinickia dinghuensis]
MTDSTRDSHESLEWRWKPFSDLTPVEVYDVLEARNVVFVVEQECVYNDVDGLDKDAWHLLAYSPEANAAASASGNSEAKKVGRSKIPTLAGYLRVLLPDASDADIRIGRVLTTSEFRGIGLGSELLEQALKHIVAQWPDAAIKLHAQAHLQMFYGAFGFEPISEVHDEDGIPHVWMRSV